MSNNSSYDKALLNEAPEVTPQQRQRFYDADLLYDDADRRQGTDGPPAPLPVGAGVHPSPGARSNTDIEAGNGTTPISKEYTQLPPSSRAISKSSTPWYKTRTGIIGLVILAIVIIGAVVGGAVGGTQANKGSKNDDSASNSTSLLPSSSESTLGPIFSSSIASTAATQAAGSGTESSETSSVFEQPTGASTESTTTTGFPVGQSIGGETSSIAIAAATRI